MILKNSVMGSECRLSSAAFRTVDHQSTDLLISASSFENLKSAVHELDQNTNEISMNLSYHILLINWQYGNMSWLHWLSFSSQINAKPDLMASMTSTKQCFIIFETHHRPRPHWFSTRISRVCCRVNVDIAGTWATDPSFIIRYTCLCIQFGAIYQLAN